VVYTLTFYWIINITENMLDVTLTMHWKNMGIAADKNIETSISGCLGPLRSFDQVKEVEGMF